jgi:DnaJ-class molecular chaperone
MLRLLCFLYRLFGWGRPTVPCSACNGKGFYFSGGRAVQCQVCKGKKRVHTYGEPEID